MPFKQWLLAAAASSAVLACSGRPDVTSPSETPAPITPKLTDVIGSTSRPAQARALLPQAEIQPIISVGDPLPNSGGKFFQPIPDGLGAYRDGNDLVLFVNHELSSTPITSDNGGASLAFARVSRLRLDPTTLEVKSGDIVEDGSSALQRLCSATWVTAAEGFPDGYFFTGEEGGSSLLESAINAQGVRTPLPRLGRFAHENYISVPGFGGKIVLVGTDDTSPARVSGSWILRSELYIYVAPDASALLAGQGDLYVFKSLGAVNSGALQPGAPITGEFVKIDQGPGGLTSSELQAQVNALGAFKFVRLEDVDYARFNGGSGNPAIYFVDTGNIDSCRVSQPCDPYGSIYRLEFNAQDPLTGAKLVLLQRSQGAQSGFASPDNIAVGKKSLMLQEDPAYGASSDPAYAAQFGDFNRAERIWNFQLNPDGSLSGGIAVAELDTEAQTGKLCSDKAGTCWESSGIIDASEWLGAGTWLFDVQAHTLPFTAGSGANAPHYVNEGGQLLYLRLPGS
jgi:hypothetical protein